MSEEFDRYSDENEDDYFSSGLLFSGEHLWIQGIHISSFDCPDCLKAEYDLEYDENEDDLLVLAEECDCQSCDFFDPDSCIFLIDSSVLQDIRSLFDVYRSKQSLNYRKYLEHRQKLVNAILGELRSHGRPLHYTVLTEIVKHRYPDMEISTSRVLRVMAYRPYMFKKVDEGVYGLAYEYI